MGFLSAALPIEDGGKALICFDIHDPHSRCEVYDSESSELTSTFETKYSHRGGKLGLYRGKPMTVGSSSGDGRNKTEILDSSGWFNSTEFPYK